MTSSPKEINELLQRHFDQVLVLTVPRFTDRQEKIKERLRGISFEFFYGVDKKELSDDFIRENYVYDKKISLSVSQQFKELNRGEIACALSHRKIYQAMLDRNWRHVLILEDDIIPEWDHLPGLFTALNELPADWELFYLGYLKNERPSFSRKIKQVWYMIQARMGMTQMPLPMIRNRLPRPFSSSLLRAGFHDCTHAYAVSQEAARKLVLAQTPVLFRADNLLSALVLKEQLKAFISRKQLFCQEIFTGGGQDSTIREKQKLSVS